MVGSRGGGRDGGVRQGCLIVNRIGGDAVTENRQGGTYVCVCVCARGVVKQTRHRISFEPSN